MRNDYYTNSKDYINRWVVSYADFVTMLLALFMVMYAVLRVDNQRLVQFNKQMEQKFSQNVTKYQDDKSQKIEQLLKDNVEQSDSVKILKTEKGIVIRLNNKILFDEGEAVVKQPALQKLQ